MICPTNLRFLHSNFFQPCSFLLIKSSRYNSCEMNDSEMKLCSSNDISSEMIMSKKKGEIIELKNAPFRIEKKQLIESLENPFLDPMQALVDSVKEGFDLSDLCYC
uniref:Uncharacterized protein n=1 Tax=Strongyloides venezuelensis TaxID=75913 RepID=A0A0K0FK54_STRVS